MAGAWERCRSVTRKAVTDAYGGGTPSRGASLPADPGGITPPSVTAMSHERNGKV